MKAETVAALQNARTQRRAVVLATRLSDAAETLVYPDRAEGALADDAALLSAARRAMGIGRSETVDIGGQKIFLNVYVPPARLIIVGAVHIAQSLAPMALADRFRRHRGRSAPRLRHRQPLSRREGDAGLGRRGVREDRARRLAPPW